MALLKSTAGREALREDVLRRARAIAFNQQLGKLRPLARELRVLRSHTKALMRSGEVSGRDSSKSHEAALAQAVRDLDGVLRQFRKLKPLPSGGRLASKAFDAEAAVEGGARTQLSIRRSPPRGEQQSHAVRFLAVL